MSLNIEPALLAAESASTRRAYRRHLQAFAEWLGARALDYSAVIEYRAKLQDDGLEPQNINQALAAIRFYATQEAEQGRMDAAIVASLKQVRNLKIKGRKLGNWLSIEEAQRLLNAPSAVTASGIRDRAILGLLIGAGLRRSEVCSLQVKHFEQRPVESGQMRWLLIGVQGKHGRTRNVPIADWVKALVDRWLDRAGIRSGIVFRSVRNEPLKIGRDALSTAAIYNVVSEYGGKIGRPTLAPHDLRRTFARLAYEGEAPLKEIQQSLGHGSIGVTERYVNAVQSITSAPSDMLGINVEV